MAQTTSKSRGLATCDNCGSILVVNVWPDDRIVPIGIGPGGKCGNADLRLVE